MTLGVTIRPATVTDHEEIVAVWRRAVEATHDFLRGDDIDWYEERVREYLPAVHDLRVALDATRVVGFVGLEENRLEMLFVEPSVHGRGVGTSLLETATADLSDVVVDVNEENDAGRAFYAARGFRQVGRSALDDEGRPHPLLHLRRIR
jgi:putative acetyltransferase